MAQRQPELKKKAAYFGVQQMREGSFHIRPASFSPRRNDLSPLEFSFYDRANSVDRLAVAMQEPAAQSELVENERLHRRVEMEHVIFRGVGVGYRCAAHGKVRDQITAHGFEMRGGKAGEKRSSPSERLGL